MKRKWMKFNRIKTDIRRGLRDIYWQIRHRTINKYHLIDTQLNPGYYDKDELMLHGSMSLLVDFVREECPDLNDKTLKTVHDKEESGILYLEFQSGQCPSSDTFDWAAELITIYNWWVHIRPARADWYSTADMVSYDTEDNDMLIRLIKCRKYMWT